MNFLLLIALVYYFRMIISFSMAKVQKKRIISSNILKKNIIFATKSTIYENCNSYIWNITCTGS